MRLLLLLQYPFVNHLGVYLELPELRLGSLLLVSLGVLLPGLSGRRPSAYFMLLAIWSCCIALALIDQTAWLYLALPVLVPLLLLIGFGRSLRAGEVALITRIGEQARGPLSPAMQRYTRGLTMVWCGLFLLFVIQGLLLIGLRLSGIEQSATESWLLNILIPVVVAVFFVGEFYLRKRRFPDHDHPSFGDYVRIVRQSG